MKNKIVNLFVAAFVTGFIFGGNVFAQPDWLDMTPLPSWNERKRAILQTKKISAAELKRCAVVVRQPTLPQDKLLTNGRTRRFKRINSAMQSGRAQRTGNRIFNPRRLSGRNVESQRRHYGVVERR